MGEKIHFEQISLTSRVFKIAFIATIMFHGRTDIPANVSVNTECWAFIGGDVGDNASANGGDGRFVVVEVAM